MKNIHGGVLILVKLQSSACNFTKINTPPWVFFTFFKLYEWYQIAQSTTSYWVSHLIKIPVNTVFYGDKGSKEISPLKETFTSGIRCYKVIKRYTIHNFMKSAPIPGNQRSFETSQLSDT